MTKRPVLFLLVMLTVVLFLSSCANVKNLETNFKNYEINSIGLSKTSLTFYFDVENPNNIPLGIRDIDYSVTLDGNRVFTGSEEGFSIQAMEKKTVSFPVEISYSDLIGEAFQMAKKFIARDGSVKYRIEGDIKVVDNIGFSSAVPINAEGNISLF